MIFHLVTSHLQTYQYDLCNITKNHTQVSNCITCITGYLIIEHVSTIGMIRNIELAGSIH